MREALTDAKKQSKKLVVVWLDLANAFGLVHYAAIMDALCRHMVLVKIINLINNLYNNVATWVRTTDSLMEPVPICPGIRRGSLLSPIVFNFMFEAIVRPLTCLGVGYRMFNMTYNNLVYADDVALLAGSLGQIRTLLRAVDDAAALVRLTFNAGKCAFLLVSGRGSTRRVRLTSLTILDEAIRLLGKGEPYDDLSTPTGLNVKNKPHEAISKLLVDVRAVDSSLLAPWHKLEIVASFLLPRLNFCLERSDVMRGPLKLADEVIRRAAKS